MGVPGTTTGPATPGARVQELGWVRIGTIPASAVGKGPGMGPTPAAVEKVG